jgi:hypothetical protein
MNVLNFSEHHVGLGLEVKGNRVPSPPVNL